MKIVVTGGLGYIGSHTCINLLNKDHDIIIIDNCVNSKKDTLNKLFKITGKKINYIDIDLRDRPSVLELAELKLFNGVDGIIHFAALKKVGESNTMPFEYYQNNLFSLLNIIELCKKLNCYNFIYSSSATVYPESSTHPFLETQATANNHRYPYMVTGPSPYGTTKIVGEQILQDISAADEKWNIVLLRYFNPVGNHSSGLIGDDIFVKNPFFNLFTAIMNKKCQGLPLTIFGNDYSTPDGTCIRDYVHVLDVADAHVRTLEWGSSKKGLHCFNIGMGKGISVKEVVDKFNEKGFNLKYEYVSRRMGDIPSMCADTKHTEDIIGWTAKYDLNRMVEDTIRYYNAQTKNR